MSPSHAELLSFCSNGNLKELQFFLGETIYSLPREEQIQYCNHAGEPCRDVPCPSKVTNLADTATQAEQITVFAYLWDTFLQHRGVRIPWKSLHAAARIGSIPLAEAFCAREPDCFNTIAPKSPHGGQPGVSQIGIAMRNDNFDYVNYMLAHGADINSGFPDHSPVRAAVLAAVEDETSLRRIRFLIDRGACAIGSGALLAAASEDRLDIVRYLISNGVKADDLESKSLNQMMTSPLISAATAGHEEIVKFLLDHGADSNYLDRSGTSALTAAEKNNQSRTIETLRNHQAASGRLGSAG